MNGMTFIQSGACAFAKATPRMLAACALAAASSFAVAEPMAPAGCPEFHCTTEATGVMYQSIIQKVSVVASNAGLGTTKAQGCSGNGKDLVCLFSTDSLTGFGQGTMKKLDVTTLQPLWGSAASGSYDLDPKSSAGAQAPQIFSDGRIAAGDNRYHVLYDATGALLGKVPLTGHGNNLGMTAITDTYGVVTQTDGVLTLVDTSTWQAVSSMTLRDPETGGQLKMGSPSSGGRNVLYAVGNNAENNHGFMFAVNLNHSTKRLELRSVFTFLGKTGATPVVVTPDLTGLSNNLILLHVPGLLKDATPENRLFGLIDKAAGFSVAWVVPLRKPLPVAPTIDEVTHSLFYVYNNGDATIYQYDYLSGEFMQQHDIRKIGGLSAAFSLNGHLISTQAGGIFTLLLSGATRSESATLRGQYAIAYSPKATPQTLLWMERTDTAPDDYTAAWSLVPSSQENTFCPIVVGKTTGITRLCDF